MKNPIKFIINKINVSRKIETASQRINNANSWTIVLRNAITMQAVSVGGKIKIIEK